MKLLFPAVVFLSAVPVFFAPLIAEPAEEAGRYELSAEFYQFTYREPGVMKDTGIFYGLAGSYTCPVRTPGWLKLEARAASGNVDYDGQLSDGTPYTVQGITDIVFEGRVLAGGRVVENGLSVDLFCGGGYRFLQDDSSFDPAGYVRQSQYLYSPVGALIGKRFGGWKIALCLEYDVFWYGMQESRLSDIDASYNDLENEQTDGWGCRVSLRLSEDAGREEFFLEPFVRYWRIEDSDLSLLTRNGTPVSYGIEPANRTLETGIRAGIIF